MGNSSLSIDQSLLVLGVLDMTKSPDPDRRNASETARLRDEGLKRMLTTPPKRHKDEPSKDPLRVKGPKDRG